MQFIKDLWNSQMFWWIVIGASFIFITAFKPTPPPKKDPLDSINDSIKELAEKVSTSIEKINK